MSTTEIREEIKKAGCAFCGGNCGVLVHLKDGKVTRIEGNRGHGLTLGNVCESVGYASKWLYHPDQLMHPLKQRGNAVKASGRKSAGSRLSMKSPANWVI
jgi:anaerobic selenocysteine-containing dehydrogenase